MGWPGLLVTNARRSHRGLQNKKVGYMTALLADCSLQIRVFIDQVGDLTVKVPVLILQVPDNTHQVDNLHHQVANPHARIRKQNA